jgi:hypothetical protein
MALGNERTLKKSNSPKEWLKLMQAYLEKI